ncbi:MAG: diguanylate cyclase [Solirubrobacteraceae bacterium]
MTALDPSDDRQTTQAERALLMDALARAQADFEEAPALALEAGEHGYTRGQLLADDALCARALTLQGDIAVYRGDLRRAAELASIAERHTLETDDPAALVAVASLRSQVHFFTGAYAQALGYADQALAVADAGEDRDLRIRARTVAFLVFGSIRLRGGRERLMELLELTRQTGNRREEAYALNNLACEHLDIGDVQGATREIERGLELAERIEGRTSFLQAVLHSTRADVRLAAGDPQAALADTQRTRLLLESVRESNPYVVAANVRAEVQAYAGLGNLDQARRSGEEALELLGDQMPHIRGQILATLATALREGDRLEEAYNALARSAELERQAFWEMSELQLDLQNATRRARTARRESEELSARNRELAEAHAELERRAMQLETLHDQLIEQADRDWLTGLRNRRYLARELEQGEDRRLAPPFSVAVLDLDRFKRINDSFGHGTGDQVLVRVAKLLSDATRETDVVVRSGGEEFLILMSHTDDRAAAVCTERMRSAIETADWTGVAPGMTLTASIGVASTREPSALEAVVQLADNRLFEAKRAGRNRVVS